jgi:hypothetical protein
VQFVLIDQAGVRPQLKYERTIASRVELPHASPDALVRGHGEALGAGTARRSQRSFRSSFQISAPQSRTIIGRRVSEANLAGAVPVEKPVNTAVRIETTTVKAADFDAAGLAFLSSAACSRHPCVRR